jgi:hypothetical protein
MMHMRTCIHSYSKDLARELRRGGAPNLRLLWLQRLDVWDDLPGLSAALADKALCPALTELYLDLTLDCDDLRALAAVLPAFPPCLKTLGMLVMGIENRTEEGDFDLVAPESAVEALAQVSAHACSATWHNCVCVCLGALL